MRIDQESLIRKEQGCEDGVPRTVPTEGALDGNLVSQGAHEPTVPSAWGVGRCRTATVHGSKLMMQNIKWTEWMGGLSREAKPLVTELEEDEDNYGRFNPIVIPGTDNLRHSENKSKISLFILQHVFIVSFNVNAISEGSVINICDVK